MGRVLILSLLMAVGALAESPVERIAAMVRTSGLWNETLSMSPAPASPQPDIAEKSCMATLAAVSRSSSASSAMWQSLVESYKNSGEQDRKTIQRQKETIERLNRAVEEPCRIRMHFQSETRVTVQPSNCNIAVEQNLGKSQQFVIDPFSNLTLDGRNLH